MKPLTSDQKTALEYMQKGWELIISEGFGDFYKRLQKADNPTYPVNGSTFNALLSRGLIEQDKLKSTAIDAFYRLKTEDAQTKSVPVEVKTKLKIRETDMGTEYEHESFGVLSIGEVTGSGIQCVGSSLEHRKVIKFEVHRAVKVRNLNNDDFFDRGVAIVEFEMSPTQFAEAITSLNHGSTPITLIYVQGKEMEEPPTESFVETLKLEIGKEQKEAEATKQKLVEKAEIYLRTGGLNKKERDELLDMIRQIAHHQSKSMFTLEQFNEQMDKVIVEAKSEVNTFLKHRAEQFGLGKVDDEIKLIGAKPQDEPKEEKSNV